MRSDMALALAIVIGGCNTPRNAEITREGVICRGFELQVFRPNGTTDTLAAGGEVFDDINAFQRTAGQGRLGWPDIPLFVRWRGTKVGPGNYGHLGQYRYAFMATRVLELRTLPDSACAWIKRVAPAV